MDAAARDRRSTKGPKQASDAIRDLTRLRQHRKAQAERQCRSARGAGQSDRAQIRAEIGVQTGRCGHVRWRPSEVEITVCATLMDGWMVGREA